jgi:L-aspartate oxidase
MILKFDYLVIGSGIAGLSFALKAAESGQVGILAKRSLSDTNTNLAQGGIAAVMGQDDLLEFHVQDTLASGGGLSRLETVQAVVEAGPRMIRELSEMGVPFTAQVDHPDQPELGREGGHSHRRIIHSKDMTGQTVQKTLVEKTLAHPNVTVFDHFLALDLLQEKDPKGQMRVTGAWVLDVKKGEVFAMVAKATVMATGGSGKVYLYTTNPDGASGDGLAMGWRAGADVANLEFVQFHPTCLFHPQLHNFLISEAVRGEGGRLVNAEGVPVMKDHPQGDLACRDVVALAIDTEMKRSGADCVFLDITHRTADFVRDPFPQI